MWLHDPKNIIVLSGSSTPDLRFRLSIAFEIEIPPPFIVPLPAMATIAAAQACRSFSPIVLFEELSPERCWGFISTNEYLLGFCWAKILKLCIRFRLTFIEECPLLEWNERVHECADMANCHVGSRVHVSCWDWVYSSWSWSWMTDDWWPNLLFIHYFF